MFVACLPLPAFVCAGVAKGGAIPPDSQSSAVGELECFDIGLVGYTERQLPFHNRRERNGLLPEAFEVVCKSSSHQLTATHGATITSNKSVDNPLLRPSRRQPGRLRCQPRLSPDQFRDIERVL